MPSPLFFALDSKKSVIKSQFFGKYPKSKNPFAPCDEIESPRHRESTQSVRLAFRPGMFLSSVLGATFADGLPASIRSPLSPPLRSFTPGFNPWAESKEENVHGPKAGGGDFFPGGGKSAFRDPEPDELERLRTEVARLKVSETRLYRERRLLQMVFDGVSEPLILVGRDLIIRMINRAAAEYYGLENGESLLRRSACGLIGQRFDLCEIGDIPETVLRGGTLTFERPGLDDSQETEQVVIYPVDGADGQTDGAVIRISDVTEARLVQRQLVQNEKLASLGLLAAGIAHEVTTPNNYLTLNLPVLREYLGSVLPVLDAYAAGHEDFQPVGMSYDEFRRDLLLLLENLDHGAGRIDRIMGGLRDFSRYRDRIRPRHCDIRPILSRVRTICGARGDGRSGVLETDIPDPFPEVFVDPAAMEQVLINLLLNACQAADPDDPRVRLRVFAGNAWRRRLILEVRDNGAGMDTETRERVFTPFFTTRADSGGTGLGLYVSRHLVESMMGTIEVESAPGAGTVFRVELPDKDRRKLPRDG